MRVRSRRRHAPRDATGVSLKRHHWRHGLAIEHHRLYSTISATTRTARETQHEAPHTARRSAAFAAAPAIVRAADKTKIVWWHAMTAALGDQVNHVVDGVQPEPGRDRGRGDLQGRLRRRADRDDRCIPRRPGTASGADLRGRHRNDAGRRQGNQAGLGAGQGDRRRDRPEGLHPGGARLLQPGRRADGVDAVQLLHRGDVVQQGCVPQGGPRSGQAARDLGRTCVKAAQAIKAKRRARRDPDDHLMAELDPARAIQRAAQHPVRQQGRRVRGAGRATADQQRSRT